VFLVRAITNTLPGDELANDFPVMRLLSTAMWCMIIGLAVCPVGFALQSLANGRGRHRLCGK
jgi:hypothetical protein